MKYYRKRGKRSLNFTNSKSEKYDSVINFIKFQLFVANVFSFSSAYRRSTCEWYLERVFFAVVEKHFSKFEELRM